ncbi:uncharacterized protein LOC142343272 isoform X2 [Convolutriloba macropyga]|uniref:uncharacterized protein LOC142343272 isoform X2 n=1 Tax=Convolutriloba macropyga TaxID=536237 RepID=UPI003F5221CE
MDSRRGGGGAEQVSPSYKIVFLGASSVGKISICHYFIKGEFSNDLASTVGATFHLQKLKVGGENWVKLKIWDTAGQERFRSLLPMYYKGCQGALIVYDMTSRESFEAAKSYLQLLRNQSEEAEVLLIANKSDLSHMRTVPTQDGMRLASNEGIEYLETSAKSGQNIREAIQKLTESIYKKSHNTEASVKDTVTLDSRTTPHAEETKKNCSC